MESQTAISILQNAERLLMAPLKTSNNISEDEALNDLLLLYFLKETDLIPAPLSENEIRSKEYEKYLPFFSYREDAYLLFLRKISYIYEELSKEKKNGMLFMAPILTSETIRLFYMDKSKRIIYSVPQGSNKNYVLDIKHFIEDISSLENSTYHERFSAAPIFAKGLFMKLWKWTSEKEVRKKCLNNIHEVKKIIKKAFEDYIDLGM